MKRVSGLTAVISQSQRKNERRYSIWYAVILFLCGLVLLSVPIFKNGILLFFTSWVMFIAAILTMLRPSFYPRGLADAVMSLMAALFYGFIGWSAGEASLSSIEGFRVVLCATLFFLGISRLLCFARLLPAAALPMLIVCSVFEFAAGVLLLLEFVSTRAANLYWFCGMLTLLGGAEVLSEASKLEVAGERLRQEHHS